MSDKLVIINEEYNATYLQSTAEGTARLAKIKSLAQRGTRLGQAMQLLFSHGVGMQIEQQTDTLLPEVISHLEWTGHKGAAIEILMKQDRSKVHPPELEKVRLLGSGDRPLDVLILANEDATSNYNARLPEPYIWAPDAGIMKWVTRVNGEYKVFVVAPGSLGALYAKAIEDVTRQNALTLHAHIREVETLSSMVKRIEMVEASEKVRQAIRTALKECQKIGARQQEIESELKDALEEQNRIAGARKWIETMKTILTIAELGMQVKAMLPNSPRNLTERIDDASKSTTPDSLQGVLASYEKSTSQLREALVNEQRVIVETINHSRTTIYDAAKANGAPSTLKPKP